MGENVPYHIEIYRLGYYGGDGARLVQTITGLTGHAQPDAIQDAATGMTSATNWQVSTGWDVPADAVSGVYLVKMVRDDNGATNQLPFIVRDDDAATKSDIVLQTSDTTWQAYNGWGGNNGQVAGNFYGDPSGTINHTDVADPGLGAQDRAYAVSYDRPFLTRDGGGAASGAQDYLFGADYAAIYFLEKNGYNVSYISGVDTDRLGADYLIGHKAYISVGHDEYWSGEQRANVEAARDAGVNLLFWSGNEVYWKTRLEANSEVPTDRTLVCYKETWANGNPNAAPGAYANIDPSNDWTGTWRDLRFVDSVNGIGDHTAVGARPENSLTGQLFGPDGDGEQGALDIPAELCRPQSLARHRHRTWWRRGYHARHPRLRMGHGARRRKPPCWLDQALRDDHSLECDPSGPGKCRCPRRRNSQPDALPRAERRSRIRCGHGVLELGP